MWDRWYTRSNPVLAYSYFNFVACRILGRFTSGIWFVLVALCRVLEWKHVEKKFFEFCPVLEKPECGAGLDKWQYIWRTVGGRLNMFWSRPNSLVTKDPCYWYWSPVPYNAMHAKLRHVLWTNCYSHQTGSLLLCTRHEQCNVVQFFQPQWTTPKTETLVPLHNAPHPSAPHHHKNTCSIGQCTATMLQYMH